MSRKVFLLGMYLFIIAGNISFAQKGISKPGNPKDKLRPVNIALKDVRTKEITAEMGCNADAIIFLENVLREVEVRTTNENKIRLVTTVSYYGNPSYSDEEWLEKLDIGLKGQGGTIVVKSGKFFTTNKKTTPAVPSSSSPAQHKMKKSFDSTGITGIAIIDSAGNWINKKANIQQKLIVYIPERAKLDISSRYAELIINNDLGELNVNIANGGIRMKNVRQLGLYSVYGNVEAIDIQKAELSLINGSIAARNINDLEIVSVNSTVDLAIVKKMTINSTSDNYEIQEVDEISGDKKYGELNLTLLQKSLDIDGVNADIKVRRFGAAATMVRIDNQYADLHLPVRSLKDYKVNVQGNNTNISAAFTLKEGAAKTFTASAGNPAGKHTDFQLKCNNCTVDFN